MPKPKKFHDDSGDLLVPFMEKPFIRVDKQEIYQYTVFLDEDITEPSKYRELTYALVNANEWDEFYIIINSKGGILDSAVQIYHSLKMTQATTTAILIGEVDSAASIVCMACSQVQTMPFSSMLLHTATWGAGDFTGRLVDSILHSERYIKDFMQDAYEGFLTSEELILLHSGKEFWVRCDEIQERFEKREEYFQLKHEKEQLAKEKAALAPKKKAPKSK